MTENELRAALHTALTGTLADEGMTVGEIIAASGIAEGRTRKALRALAAKGQIRVGRRVVQDIAGRTQRVPTYMVLE